MQSLLERIRADPFAIAQLSREQQLEIHDFRVLMDTALSLDGRVIRYITSLDRTEARCLVAVTGDFPVLEALNEAEQTELVCMASITVHPWSLKDVIHQTDAMIEKAISLDSKTISMIKEWNVERLVKLATRFPEYTRRFCQIYIEKN